MTTLVSGERWPLDSSPRGVPGSPTKSEYMSICQNQGTTCQLRHYHFGRVTPNILSKRRICCPRLVIIIPLEVNHIILVLLMFKNYSVVSVFFRMTQSQHVDERRFEILKTTFVSLLCFFILLNLIQSNFVRFLLLIPWIIVFSKDFS